MELVLLINLKLLTIAIVFLLNIAEHEYISANKYENGNYCWHSAEENEESFITTGPVQTLQIRKLNETFSVHT